MTSARLLSPTDTLILKSRVDAKDQNGDMTSYDVFLAPLSSSALLAFVETAISRKVLGIEATKTSRGPNNFHDLKDRVFEYPWHERDVFIAQGEIFYPAPEFTDPQRLGLWIKDQVDNLLLEHIYADEVNADTSGFLKNRRFRLLRALEQQAVGMTGHTGYLLHHIALKRKLDIPIDLGVTIVHGKEGDAIQVSQTLTLSINTPAVDEVCSSTNLGIRILDVDNQLVAAGSTIINTPVGKLPIDFSQVIKRYLITQDTPKDVKPLVEHLLQVNTQYAKGVYSMADILEGNYFISEV